ncbi:Ima1 N-terminal domain-containing protein [Dipodascopsis tothii]|uniref:Ima1 N-terminal domain-containing protein n=1 Tax=Dipodascopsis tothii TaxID=44089 RepID=UPI0034CD3982
MFGLQANENTARKTLRCFCCNQTSSVDAVVRGTPSRTEWTCPICEALNVRDKNGQVDDYVPGISDYGAQYAHAVGQVQFSQTPFCRTCETNQSIVQKILAEYLPDERDPEYAVRSQSLEAYRTTLEERYPPVCLECRPKVVEQLKRNNYSAKSHALGSFLARSQNPRLRSVSGQSQTGADGDHRQRVVARHLGWRGWGLMMWIKVLLWSIRGGFWWTYYGLCMAMHAIAYLEPTETADVVQAMVPVSYLTARRLWTFAVVYSAARRLLWFNLLFIFWDYRWLQAASATQSVTIAGKRGYKKWQLWTLALRVATVLSMPRLSELSLGVYAWTNLALVVVTSVFLVVSLLRLRVIPRGRIDLHERVDLKVAAAQEDHSLFSTLSLSDL